MNAYPKSHSVVFSAVVLGALGSLVGCSSASSEIGESSPTETASAGPTEVGRVTLSDATVVVFYALTRNGKAELGVREIGSAYAPLIVAQLLERKLTTQEIYLALAPQGASAPPALVAAQADEAAGMDRSPEVQHVTLDSSIFVQKSGTECENGVTGAIRPPNGSSYSWQVDEDYTIKSGAQTIYEFYPSGTTTDWVIWGACVWSSSPGVAFTAEELYNNDNTQYYIFSNVNVNPGNYGAWYWRNTGGAEYYFWNSSEPSGENFEYLIGHEVTNIQ